jgi:hypothetical protein
MVWNKMFHNKAVSFHIWNWSVCMFLNCFGHLFIFIAPEYFMRKISLLKCLLSISSAETENSTSYYPDFNQSNRMFLCLHDCFRFLTCFVRFFGIDSLTNKDTNMYQTILYFVRKKTYLMVCLHCHCINWIKERYVAFGAKVSIWTIWRYLQTVCGQE